MPKLKRLNIEISAVCNYRCESCPNTYMARPKGFMGLDAFKRIFDEADGNVEEIFLWNYGESLLNPAIGEMLAHLKGAKSQIILSTTGAPISKMRDPVALANVNELIISINGLDQDTYAFHQKKGDFGGVLEGLEKIASIMKDADTDYVMQFVVNKENLPQLQHAEEFARQYHFKRLDVKTFNVMNNSQDTFDKYIPPDLQYSRYTGFNIPKSPRSEIPAPCLSWMVINWNGDTNPCCWDYKGEIILGNAVTAGVKNAWNSAAMEAHRKRIEAQDLYPICTNCHKDGTLLYRKRLT